MSGVVRLTHRARHGSERGQLGPNGDRRMTFASRRDAAIERALADKRITNAAWWRFAILDEAALTRFEQGYGKPPSPSAPVSHSDREQTAEAFVGVPLTDEERHVARSMGLTEAEYQASKLDTVARAAAWHGTGDAEVLRIAATKARAAIGSSATHDTPELTAEERAMAHKMGVTEAEYAEAKKGGI